MDRSRAIALPGASAAATATTAPNCDFAVSDATSPDSAPAEAAAAATAPPPAQAVPPPAPPASSASAAPSPAQTLVAAATAAAMPVAGPPASATSSVRSPAPLPASMPLPLSTQLLPVAVPLPLAASAGAAPANKIVSRNANSTLVVTSAPSNEAELQLFRVMQRASLLAYYDTLLEMGGDDVQQLCDAGEEEFLEIMALVGMASKPLHVRRLQKALQEWVSNPALFQTPLVPTTGAVPGLPFPVVSPPLPLGAAPRLSPVSLPLRHGPPPTAHPVPVATSAMPLPLPLAAAAAAAAAAATGAGVGTCALGNVPSRSPPATSFNNHGSPGSSGQEFCRGGSATPGASPSSVRGGSCAGATSPGPSLGSGGGGGSPLQLTPVLLESQVMRLAEAADALASALPPLSPRPPHGTKRRLCRDLEVRLVMSMPEEDPRRMEEIRKYAAIYGRFDCKRKPEKPLTLHEVSVNEAAAQLCRCMPALLARRDELFPLARQVVRDAGCAYTKVPSGACAPNGGGALAGGSCPLGTLRSVSPSSRSSEGGGDDGGGMERNGDDVSRPSSKRARLDPSAAAAAAALVDAAAAAAAAQRQERLEHVAEELRALGERTDELLAVAAAAAAGDAGGGSGGGGSGVGCARLHALHSQWSALTGSRPGALMDAAEAAARAAPSIQALSALSVTAHPRFFRRGGVARASGLPDTERPDTDDTDSQLSFSNASSPSQDIGDSREAESLGGGGGSGSSVTGGGTESERDRSSCKISRQLVQDTLLNEGLRVVKEMVANQNKESESEPSLQGQSSCDSFQESKVQVIASKGGNIIAVANPALSMSPAISTDGTDNTLVPFLRNSTPLILKQEIMSPVSTPAVPSTKIE